MEKNVSIHISDRSHVNLTLNVYNCGNQDIVIERQLRNDYYTFYFVKEGMGYVTQKQGTHKVHAGEGFVIYPNSEASIKSGYKKPMNVTWVAFSGYLVERYLSRAGVSCYEPVFRDTEDRELEQAFDKLLSASMKMPNRYCKIMAQLYTAIGIMLDNAQTGAPTAATTPEYMLIRALDFIDSNYHDDITVEDIAAAARGSRKALGEAFKSMTGYSPKDYLIYYRMCKATLLLKDPNLSVETVATSVGYSDQFHFSKEFKKNVGLPPSEYRKEIAKDPSKGYLSPIDAVRQRLADQPDEKPPEL